MTTDKHNLPAPRGIIDALRFLVETTPGRETLAEEAFLLGLRYGRAVTLEEEDVRVQLRRARAP